MKRAILVVAGAVIVAACGASTPTSTEVALAAGQGGELAAQQNPSACPAVSISLSYTPRDGRHVMTVVFHDARSNDVAPVDCPALVWSVTPQAPIQPLFDGSRVITQAELIPTGPPQPYTVTAASGAMTATLRLTAGR